MKIIDTFIFYNELDMLFFRLTELYEYVDYFVICESTFTFTGQQKPLFFLDNKERFKDFQDKIVHIVVKDMPNTRNPWDNEYFQRKCIHRGIEKLSLQDDDIIMIGDCDEIPDSDIVAKIKTKCLQIDEIHCFQMDFYYYNLETFIDNNWISAKVLPYKVYKEINDPSKIRSTRNRKHIKNGGWHFSYFGDKKFIENKIKNFSHQEFNKQYIIRDIQNKITNKKDLFNRNITLKHRDISTNSYLPNNYELLIKFTKN